MWDLIYNAVASRSLSKHAESKKQNMLQLIINDQSGYSVPLPLCESTQKYCSSTVSLFQMQYFLHQSFLQKELRPSYLYKETQALSTFRSHSTQADDLEP